MESITGIIIWIKCCMGIWIKIIAKQKPSQNVDFFGGIIVTQIIIVININLQKSVKSGARIRIINIIKLDLELKNTTQF